MKITVTPVDKPVHKCAWCQAILPGNQGHGICEKCRDKFFPTRSTIEQLAIGLNGRVQEL